MRFFDRRLLCGIILLISGSSCQIQPGGGDLTSAEVGEESAVRFHQMMRTERNYTIAGMSIRHPYSLYTVEPPENYWVFGVLPKGTILQITEARPKGSIQPVGNSYYVATVKSGMFRDWKFEIFEEDVRRWEKWKRDMR